ncbi:hypothetical protein JCM33374_g4315 [Metschnikowia sp. JCM 33374]|nr:hypothetical protein JCM33374_g4315 [Metschnikowia sp. JCM 33374]
MVSFTLLTSGGERNACTATLLDFDGEIRVLADPGWNGDNPDDVLFLEKYLGDVDFMVLSQSTPEFVGAYILLCIKFPMLMRAIPVYATVAVSQLARVATVEFYRARGVLGPVSTALLEVGDVDEWYDKVVSVKFFQNMAMLENRIMLTAYNSGHTLGGAFWLITKRMEKVVYAPTWNHSKDSFLNSAGFISASSGTPVPSLVRPTTLITGSDLGSPMPHKKRTHQFLSLVNATLANGGAVLLPVSISGRFLELLHIIDEHLSNLPGAAIPVYFLSYSGTKVLSYASNLLDWMSSQLIKQYEGLAADSHAYSQVPFEPAKVDLLSDPRELIQIPGPKIVFASGLDFGKGDLSTQALQYLCQDEKSTLILTEKSSFASSDPVTASLYEEWHKLASQKSGGIPEDGIPVPLEKTISMDAWTTEEDLSGRELAEFKERVSALRRQKLLEKVRDKKNKNILNEEDDDDSSSDDNESSDEEVSEKTRNTESTEPTTSAVAPAGTADALKTHEIFVGDYITENLDANKPIDIRVTFKMKPKQSMFPMPISGKKRKIDDYGEVIDMKDFQSADDNNANNKLISESKRKFELHDKGKWGERDERRRGGRRGGDHQKSASTKNKLTPQETLNNEVLQKNLDALFKPVKRIALRDLDRSISLQLKVRCGLSFVDLSGLVDLRSLVMIVSVLRPQNLVLLPDPSYAQMYDEQLNGRRLLESAFEKQKSEQKSKIASDSLLSSSRFSALTSSHRGMAKTYNNEMKVYAVKPNDVTQIGGDGSGRLREFEVKLDEQLDSQLRWQKLDGNYRITQVRGELSIYESQLSLNKKNVDSLALSSQFILKPLSETADAQQATERTGEKYESPTGSGIGSSLAIGNVRLPELKKKLMALDLDAEFKGEGMLVVNDEVAIKKISMGAYQGEDTGDLVIDGSIGPLYYKVKNCIKEMLAFV